MSDTDLRDEVAQLKLLLKQEEGKRIAVEQESVRIKREAKIVEEQAAALRAETDNSLLEAAEQMKVALAVSQGIWAFAHMGRSFLARKVAAGRIVHREQQMTMLMQRMMDAHGKDPTALQAAFDQAKAVIDTVKRDGEATRVQVAEATLSHGLSKFMDIWESLLASNNTLLEGQ